jgi:aspartyl-tRNA(Asn)/glutamyl-tRNA(Gln) amidotransferase subunit A
MVDVTTLTLSDIVAGLESGAFSSVEVTRAYLARIEQVEPQVRAFITLTPERALADAERADARRKAGERAPLLGVPVGIKDVLSTKGVQTTAGSKILEGYVPVFDATSVRRLLEAGVVVVGKLNCDEFAMGSSTENSAYQVTRNPWDLERVPGGSSGGSAAAVAARMVAATLGTDTGGSIRQPGAFCGISALKPSYGRVSRYGLLAYGSSLDSVGPMAHTVEDAARVLQVIAGHDPLDATSRPEAVPDYVGMVRGAGESLKGLRVGIPAEYFVEGMQPEVEASVRAALRQLEALGAELVEISLPHTRYGLPVYYLLATSEASSNLARYDGVRFGLHVEKGDMWQNYRATRGQGFGAEVKRRIMLGTYALSAGYYDAFYGKASQVRTLIKRDFDEAFQKVDVIAAATSPTTAFKIGQNTEDPLAMYLADVLTITLNLAGVCGLNVPCGYDATGLPIGLQLIGAQLGEAEVLRVGQVYQQTTDWLARKPAL